MSIKSQQANMKIIHILVSRDLGYIHGKRESGPNGAKKQFLTKSAAFLRALGNDLGFSEAKVMTNPGGIAVSGDITLMGLWSDGNGLYFQISQPFVQPPSFMYRHIAHMKDYRGGPNQWLSCSMFEDADYERLINTLSSLKESAEAVQNAA
jgi:hypothetical protein